MAGLGAGPAQFAPWQTRKLLITKEVPLVTATLTEARLS